MFSWFMASLFYDLPQPCSDPEVSSVERKHSKEDTAKVSARGEPSVTSGKHVELQVHIS